jgi:hypothetical protein
MALVVNSLIKPAIHAIQAPFQLKKLLLKTNLFRRQSDASPLPVQLPDLLLVLKLLVPNQLVKKFLVPNRHVKKLQSLIVDPLSRLFNKPNRINRRAASLMKSAKSNRF